MSSRLVSSVDELRGIFRAQTCRTRRRTYFGQSTRAPLLRTLTVGAGISPAQPAGGAPSSGFSLGSGRGLSPPVRNYTDPGARFFFCYNATTCVPSNSRAHPFRCTRCAGAFGAHSYGVSSSARAEPSSRNRSVIRSARRAPRRLGSFDVPEITQMRRGVARNT